MVAQIEPAESAEHDDTPGLDGKIFHDSTGAGIVAGGEG
jgi:hypothetical protein